MIRQYNPQCFRQVDFGGRARKVGRFEVGYTFYRAENCRPFSRVESWDTSEPWRIVAWLNREYFPAVPGGRAVTFMVGGHLAVVQSLRTGEVMRLADWQIERGSERFDAEPCRECRTVGRLKVIEQDWTICLECGADIRSAKTAPENGVLAHA